MRQHRTLCIDLYGKGNREPAPSGCSSNPCQYQLLDIWPPQRTAAELLHRCFRISSKYERLKLWSRLAMACCSGWRCNGPFFKLRGERYNYPRWVSKSKTGELANGVDWRKIEEGGASQRGIG